MTMPLYKKIFILIVIFLFSYILHRLYKKRAGIVKEGFLFSKTVEEEISNATNKDISISLNSLPSAYVQLPISQFAIKGSFNSAITQNFVSLDMLKYVLSRGCRFVDFEVFYLDRKPMVSYSNDPLFSILETDNKILLDNVLSSAIANAFNSPSPNTGDPLFIQLRIKSNDDGVYKEVAKSINNALLTRLYKGQVTNKTKMSDIMGKVVLVMDRTINYQYKNLTGCSNPNDKTCYDLTKFINVESGSDFMHTTDFTTLSKMTYTPPTINSNGLTTTAQYIRIGLPDITSNSTANPDPKPLIQNHGCQILLYRFYIKDQGLETYETIFNDNIYGIVPLSIMLMYISKNPSKNMNSVKNRATGFWNAVLRFFGLV